MNQNMKMSEPASDSADDTWLLAARQILRDGEVATFIHAVESDDIGEDAAIREERRVARHVADLLREYFPAPQARQEGAAADLLAALVPHVERLIEADLRLKHPNIPAAGSLVIRAFTAERLLANESNPTENQDEQLLLLQNYLSLNRAVVLLEAVERDPACIWRIASGRVA